jgi:hypothetical protein
MMGKSGIVVIKILITTKQSGLNNRVNLLEGFSFHEKTGS